MVLDVKILSYHSSSKRKKKHVASGSESNKSGCVCRLESAFGGEQSPLLSRFDISRREGKARVAARNRRYHTHLFPHATDSRRPFLSSAGVNGAISPSSSRGPRSCLARATRSIPTAPIAALMRAGAHAHTRSPSRARTHACHVCPDALDESRTRNTRARIFPVDSYFSRDVYFVKKKYI